MQDVLTLVLGGGKGARLYPLTQRRSEPAVPIAGKYRLIDIPISNCLNSGLRRIYVLTQFLSVSLHRHIAHTYKFGPFSRGFVEVLAAQQTNENSGGWYLGTADAVRQNIRYIREDGCREMLLLSGDQIYRMDFQKLLAEHRDNQADVTIGVVPVTRDQAGRYGIVRIDATGRIVEIVEKPSPERLEGLRTPAVELQRRGIDARGRDYLANMGIYLFCLPALLDLLNSPPPAVDFVTQILPRHLGSHHVRAYLFDGYWEDLGTVRSYYQASLALASDDPPFDFHSPEGVIYTRSRNLPAARMLGAHVSQVLLSDGCIVEPGARLERCVIGVRSRIGRDVTLRDTVLIGADRFETEEERATNRSRGLPSLGIGDGSVIERAILDKDCRIGRNVRILDRGRRSDRDERYYVIRDGIVVVPNGAVGPDGTVIEG
ncbi:MAG: glucose-1-phosphate adenylyltransferase [Gemmataceae bacterium]|nr:glucose-1-phosphate adenylyltransferase [Gemmataceae bacterium]